MVDTSPDMINLQLGDIIEILSPENPILNLQEFFIEFINSDKIILLNINNKSQIQLNIINGELDSTIEQINLLSRSDSPSFAIQNNLIPGTWVEILFKLDDLEIKGQIVNLEKDQIEISTYPSNDTIYIDFAFEGIPEDLDIKNISIIKNPVDEVIQQISKPEPSLSKIDAEPDIIKDQLKQDLLDGDQIILGEDLEDITFLVEVPESERRYSLELQTSDLLDELLSNIPSNLRTNTVLNKIHKTIERYIQLRQAFSNIDSNGLYNSPEPISDDFKPIVNQLYNLEINPKWFIPVSFNQKKLYDVNTSIINELSTASVINNNEFEIFNEETDIYLDYLKGSSISDENKYFVYFNKINNLYTPFNKPINYQDSIFSGQVNANITSIINNTDNFVSIVAGNTPGEISNKSYLMTEYNTGLNYLKNSILTKLTPSDTITISSVVTLPIDFLLNSKIYTPNCSILTKTELNLDYLYLFNSLKNINSVLVDDLNNVQIPEFVNFKNYKNYILNETLQNNSKDTYNSFLNKILPNSIQSLKIIKNLNKNKLSSYSLSKELELFHIFQKTITLQNQIDEFIDKNINFYKSKLSYHNSLFKKYSSQIFSQPNVSSWFTILEKHKALYSIVVEAYDLTPDLTTVEVLDKIFAVDYGLLFTYALIRIDFDLQSNNIVNEFVEKYKQSITQKSQMQNICKYITKKYSSLEDLQNDNTVEIVADPEFDKTDYKFMNNYKDQDTTSIEFKEFLKTQLLESKGLTAQEAEREANALILNKLLVEEGDYAIVNITTPEGVITTNYYIRKNNEWILDEALSIGNVEISDNKLFCTLQPGCLSNNTCNNLDITDSNLNEDVLKQIYSEFDKKYEEQTRNVREKIDEILQNAILRIRLLKRYNIKNFYKYNIQKQELSDLIEIDIDLDQSSPFENLRDLILGISDFVKKQNYIQKFVLQFTREPFSSEDQFWLYCIKTNVKLLPRFLSTLANVYISGGDYLFAIDKICTEQGTISDDGEAFVDKHSGYHIKNIEFNTEEGFTEEGFVLKTREKLEKDLGDAVLELASAPTPSGLVLTEEGKLVLNIVKAITGPSGMGINLESQYQFIVDNVLNIHRQIAPTKEKFEKISAKLAKEGKKPIPYEDQVGRPLIILTFVFISIAIQTNIPSIESSKTFPNCIRAFEGYPLFGEDEAPIIYIACIARKMKNDAYPWSTIRGLKEEKIVSQIKNILDGDKYKILNIPSIRLKIDEKRRYLKNTRKKLSEEIIENLDQGIFPPLFPYSVNPSPLTDTFKQSLGQNIKSGSIMQEDQIGIIKSKIIQFGLAVQQSIINIVKKENPLISSKTGVIFMENTCCNSSSPKIVKYFTEKDSSINQNNAIVISMSNILKDIKTIVTPYILYDPRDSRYYYPELPENFSSDTIYRAFIVFCRDKNLQFDESLLETCNLSNKEINLPTESIIEKLKQDGISYDQKLFEKLLMIVNNKNTVKVNYNPKSVNIINKLEDLLKIYQESDSSLPKIIVSELNTLIDTYSLEKSQQEGRKLKNYLDTENNLLLNKINEFVTVNSGSSKSKLKNFTSCISNIEQFLEIGEDILMNKENQTTFRTINFIKDSLYNLINLYPNIILNKITYDNVQIPKHWKLTNKHTNDIKDMLQNYYKIFNKFFDNKDLESILKNISVKCKNILDLARVTPYYAERPDKKSNKESIFDTRLVLLLYKYYFLQSLNIHIELSVQDKKEISEIEVLSISQETPSLPLEVTTNIETGKQENPVESFLTQATIAGAKKEKMEIVALYLVNMIEIICINKSDIDVNKESIMNKILVSKEREKSDITDYLKNLTEEEREVENIFKNQKLEKWGLGLQKGLREYVGENYDNEREKLEQQLINDKKFANVSERNQNIYADDFMQEQAIADEIDRDEYSLANYAGEDENEPDYDDFEETDEY